MVGSVLLGATFGQRLKAAMRARRKTGRDVAAALGVHETTVSGWVNDRVNPEHNRYRQMSEELGVSAAWLEGGLPAETTSPPHAPRPDPAPTLRSGRYAMPPAVSSYVRDGASARNAVQTHIAQGQTHLAAWLVEYSASLLEAAAADTRAQLGALLVHEDNAAEVEAINRELAADTTPDAAGDAAPRRSRRSAG